MMMSSRMITLFSEPVPVRGVPPSFWVSTVFHVIVFAVLVIGLQHTSQLRDATLSNHLMVRLLDAPRIEAQKQTAAKGGRGRAAQGAPGTGSGSGGAAASLPTIPSNLAELVRGTQTVVQPDAPPELVLPKETQVPLVVMWSPKNSIDTAIVPPPPQAPSVAPTRPSLARPNQEVPLADVQLSASLLPSEKLPIAPSTTTPVVVTGPAPVKRVPETTAQQAAQPTPARVVSLSDFQSVGPVVVPVGNQAAQAAPAAPLSLGRQATSTGVGGG